MALPENGKPLGSEAGQVLIEGIVWISLLMAFAIGFLKVSNLEYRAYRKALDYHDSRAGRGSFPSH